MNRLYVDFPARGQDKPLRSAFAVVDRLPGPLNAVKVPGVHESSSVLPPVVTAHEGFGLYLHETLSDADVPPGLNNNRYNRILRFYLRATQPSDRSTTATTCLELRPANTLFINGSDCTMFQDQWRLAAGQGSSHWVPEGPSEQLQLLDCHLRTLPVTVHLPMEALTVPCEIVSGMGNVLRQLRGTDAGSTISASAELEKEVPKFLAKRQKYSGTLSVFALITPSSDTKQFISNAPILPTGHDLLHIEAFTVKDAISRGAHLHKVTSGGGGWGKKAGLLSLDPALDFEDVETTGVLDDMLDLPGSDTSASTSIVKPGDYVQFFATFDSSRHRHQSSKQVSIADATKDEEWSTSAEQCFALGAISSQEEQVQPTEAHSSADNLVYLPNHFGMLSEGGTCVKSVTLTRRVKEAGIPQVDNDISIVKSRMDIPYGTWVLISRQGAQ